MSFLNYVKFIVCLWELVGVSFLGSLGSCSGSLLRVFLTGLASFAAFVFYLFELLMKEWCCAVPGLESHDQHLAALILAGTLNFESLGSLVCVGFVACVHFVGHQEAWQKPHSQRPSYALVFPVLSRVCWHCHLALT